MEPDAMNILEELGIEPSRVGSIETLSERHGYRVWRVTVGGERRVLKWLPPDAATREIGGFELLHRCGVPTLQIYAQSRNALLLEDLATSSTWRLADSRDVDSPLVGAAVADWYRTLHAAGEKLLASFCPAFLRRESDELTPDTMRKAARSLGLTDAPVWNLAVQHIVLLRAAEAKLSLTLNYQDFHWTNLALSRVHPVAVVVFDYDNLGIGMRYSDCRNVEGSLGQTAREAFRRRYGEYDEQEMVIDLPLASLCALVVASRHKSFPKWAEESRCRALNGELLRDLERAIAIAQGLME
ncbi:phosphotransferase [Candidatus Eisenbacteria bacterium]|uniref:Phosphotransferase n=1 Tax=Eiseniibacteriota bacterium TaxID=2212470 RepID=A0ABV6YM00_UNCEI